MTGYYDYVLGLIPAALIGVTASLTLVGLSLTAALPAGALAAGALIAHAMFVRTPVRIEGHSADGPAGEWSTARSTASSTARSTTPSTTRSTGGSQTGRTAD